MKSLNGLEKINIKLQRVNFIQTPLNLEEVQLPLPQFSLSLLYTLLTSLMARQVLCWFVFASVPSLFINALFSSHSTFSGVSLIPPFSFNN